MSTIKAPSILSAVSTISTAALLVLVSACGTAQSGDSKVNGLPFNPNPTTIAESISDTTGDAFMTALLNTGVYDTTGLLGTDTITVQTLSCGSPVVPQPVPHCTISWNGQTLQASADDASTLFSILSENGGTLSNNHVLGSDNAQATNITCRRVVYPNALGSCTFSVLPQQQQ